MPRPIIMAGNPSLSRASSAAANRLARAEEREVQRSQRGPAPKPEDVAKATEAALPREEEAPMGSGIDAKNAALVAQAAEKVAKEEPLELLKKGDKVGYYVNGEPRILKEDDEWWREYGGTAFESALQVDPEHGVSPVKLIDMRFIIALGELGGTMVRRQDLPKEAFIDLDTLKRLNGGPYSLPIISISHPWQQPDHPDPKEVNLQLLAKVMKLMLEAFGGTFAVFFE